MLLAGHTPYAITNPMTPPWDMVMPYGPALWGPFLIPQLLHLDFRIVTIIGELFIPVWCGVASFIGVGARQNRRRRVMARCPGSARPGARYPGIHVDWPYARLLAAYFAVVVMVTAKTTMDGSRVSPSACSSSPAPP